MSMPKNLDSTGQLVDQVVEMKRTLGQFARLIEISLTLNTTLDQDFLLKFIIETAQNIMECEAVSLLLYDDQAEKLRFTASTHLSKEELAQIPVPLDNSIAGTIFTENRPLIINNTAEDPRHFQIEANRKTGFLTRSLAGVPMQIQDQATGVLEAINKTGGDFTQEDIDILSVIASQAAVAINNARMMLHLQQALQELSQLDKLKSDFIALASHELRTPLLHILGYAELLKEDAEADATRTGHAEKVINSALKLQTLVDDMTNMNLLETGSQELELEQIPIQQIVAQAFKGVQQMAHAKSQNCEIKLPRQPYMVNADTEKVERALLNVMNNAIRFTPNGGSVRITVTEEDNIAKIEVQDNGPGIPPQELENIFEEFFQIEDHLTRAYGGMGLGLSIARGIIRLHGGHIWAKSEGVGKGATFNITLPMVS